MAEFTPYSFGGTIPVYVYNGAASSTSKIIIGEGANLWKLDVDTTDDNKLKIYYSSDSGTSWTVILELTPLS